MNKYKRNVVPASYIIGTVSVVTGAFLKVMHHPFANVALAIGLLSTIVFLITALIEIHSSARIHPFTKKMYTLGLLLSATLVGLIYMLQRKQHVLQ